MNDRLTVVACIARVKYPGKQPTSFEPQHLVLCSFNLKASTSRRSLRRLLRQRRNEASIIRVLQYQIKYNFKLLSPITEELPEKQALCSSQSTARLLYRNEAGLTRK